MKNSIFKLILSFLLVIAPELIAQQITSFTLIDATTDNAVGTITEGSTFDLSDIGSSVNIRANTTGTIGSVRFWLDDIVQKTEGVAPYTMFGDNNGDFDGLPIEAGSHKVKATVFSGSGGTGTAENTLSVNFNITDENYAPPTDPGTGEVQITGELKKWHKVTLSFDGPAYSETSSRANPFLDFQLNVTFTNGEKCYVVPGYFAADGNAAESSADSGNVWRVHFAPDETGEWSYDVAFYFGRNVAISNNLDAATAIAPIHGKTGAFTVTSSDKTGKDNRAKGRLKYVGEHHLQYSDTGEFFIKGGADAPENFLAYSGFDGGFKGDGEKDDLIKDWGPHVSDWRTGDPIWQGNSGKGIIGAINYLASEDLNVFSFLTMNIEGDDRNVFPYVSHTDYQRFDCSKLDQWEIVFNHADTLGMYLHFKTQETENDHLLDGGDVGTNRKLYYRELIARFGHHLALNWNLGEENSQSTQQRKDMAEYFYENDPYQHHVVLHTFPNKIDEVYSELVGDQSEYTGISIQTHWNQVYSNTSKWVKESAAQGRKWVVANDEQGSAEIGVPEDAYTGTPNKDDIRKQTLWGNYMAGGAGVEYYFGYQRPESDLSCEDYRSRDISWDYVRYAKNFFKEYVQFWKMQPMNNLVSRGWCLAKEGEMYVVYLNNGGIANLNVRDTATYIVKWFDPRNGGELQNGTVTNVKGRGEQALGSAPNNETSDWAILIYRSVEGLSTPTAEISSDTTYGDKPLTVNLNATASTGATNYYWYLGDGTISNGETTSVTFSEKGNYEIVLVATNEEGISSFDYLTIEVGSSVQVFEEQDGFLQIEAEDLTLTESWTKGSAINDASGGEYIYWTGGQYFANTSNGHIDVEITINTPGIYHFIWRVAIAKGTSTTEHNDSWLKVNADDFYGFRSATNSYVHPRPLCQSSLYKCPEGNSKDGFFKLFGGGVNSFRWKAMTSDSDDHKIYVQFNEAKKYTFTIAARSSYHCIDVMKFTKTADIPEDPEEPTDLEKVTANEVTMFPNPANDKLNFGNLSGIKVFSITNIHGQVVHRESPGAISSKIDISNFTAGIYIVQFKTKVGNSFNKKLIIE